MQKKGSIILKGSGLLSVAQTLEKVEGSTQNIQNLQDTHPKIQAPATEPHAGLENFEKPDNTSVGIGIEEVLPSYQHEFLPTSKLQQTKMPEEAFDALAKKLREEVNKHKEEDVLNVMIRESSKRESDFKNNKDSVLAVKPQTFGEGVFVKDNVKTKVSIKSSRRRLLLFEDIFTVVVCLASTFICVQAFFNSFNQSLQKINEDPIATITYKYNSAQRKLSDRVLWDRVTESSPVFDGDIIRTADFSEAIITFTDGNSINLYEQTLIQVSHDEEGAAINFSGGQISVNSAEQGSEIQLVSGDTSISLGAGSSLFASAQTEILDGMLTKDAASPLTVQVTNGEALFVTPDILNDVILNTDTTFVVSADGASMQEKNISVFVPHVNAKFLRIGSEKMDVIFNWAVSPNTTDAYVLEVSKNKDFSELEEQRDVAGLSTETIALNDGLWYWRLYSDELTNSVEGKFRVLSSDYPKTIAPAQNEEFIYGTVSPSIRFLWSEDVYAERWLLEIADNENMENPIITQESTLSSSIIKGLGEGTWYWAVCPLYPQGMIHENMHVELRSEVSSFSVTRTGDLLPVDLTLPRSKVFLDTNERHHFLWEHSDEAVNYTVFLSQNSDMSNPILSSEIIENFFMLSPNEFGLDRGLWYWSVAKKTEDGNMSSLGEVRSFYTLAGQIHDGIEPKNNESIPENEIGDYVFTWENNLPYDTYVQVSQDENFSSLFFEELAVGSEMDGVELPVGKWYWRIISNDTAFEMEHKSEPIVFFVDPSIGMVSPLEPLSESEVVFSSHEDVLFSWERVENAEYYDFKLFEASNRDVPVYENTHREETSLMVNMQSMPLGEYIYSISAVTENTPSQIVQKGTVREVVFSTRIIEPIQLKELPDGAIIDGVSALLNPSFVQWSAPKETQSTVFLLSKSEGEVSAISIEDWQSDLNSQTLFYVENPSETIMLPPLTDGLWFWRVIGETQTGVDVSAQRPYRIIVSPIEALAPPRIISPSENVIFDVEYFTKNNSIEFSWAAVENADEYTFTLYNATNDILVNRVLQNETSFYFEDLAILDRGSFTWTIEATRSLPQGIEQGGETRESVFIIDLPMVMTPENTTRGILYGL